jgi:pimeloyl-ACP methyl ester carboxylesterase
MTLPVVRRSFTAHGRNVSYLTVEDTRASETLLLIHGAGVSARTWVNQLRGLADVVRPIAIDLPGRRESDAISGATLELYAETAYQALEQLHTGPAFVAGHSLGGAVAQLLAARHPDLVKGLMLLSTCASMPPADNATRLFAWVPPQLRRAVLSWAARRVLFAPSASEDVIRFTLEEMRECGPATIQTDAAIGRTIDLEKVAPALRVPTLVLCGDGDRLTAPALSRRLGALIPGSRLEFVRDAGHMLPLEAPAIVNARIADFVHALAGPAAVPAPPPVTSRRRELRLVVERLVGRLPWRRFWRAAPEA